MESINFKEKLYSAFKQNNLDGLLDDQKADKLYELYNTLVETNKTFNLTAITDENDVILKHFVDCAAVLAYILPEGYKVPARVYNRKPADDIRTLPGYWVKP